MAQELEMPSLSKRQQYVLVAVVAVVVGIAFVPAVLGVVDDSADGTVAVVEFEGPVVVDTAEQVEDELREIRRDGSVDAVVLKIDTPGGSPAASEQLYTSVQRTAEEMPVMASVQEISASGGYYAMLPTDEIYVLPTSITGSVGVNADAPEPQPPVDGPTGPDKVGENTLQSWAQIEQLDEVFVESVMEQRGDRIELSREEVASADTFIGVEAVENGLADEIGDTDTAIAAAADAAGLETYDIEVREAPALGVPILLSTDTGYVAVHETQPGYQDVEFLGPALVAPGSVPHVDDVNQFVSENGGVENATTTEEGS